MAGKTRSKTQSVTERNWPHSNNYTTQFCEQFGSHGIISFGLYKRIRDDDPESAHHAMTVQDGMASLSAVIMPGKGKHLAEVLRRLADVVEQNS